MKKRRERERGDGRVQSLKEKDKLCVLNKTRLNPLVPHFIQTSMYMFIVAVPERRSWSC